MPATEGVRTTTRVPPRAPQRPLDSCGPSGCAARCSTMAQSRGKVLIVDDEVSVSEVLRRLLTKAGYEIQVAPNGAAALELVHSGPPPDLILLDLAMPVMSGFEVLSALRANT